MKVLVLVQSIEEGRYTELIQTQKETWDSVNHPQVQTVFYMPHETKEGFEGKNLYIRENLHWGLMYVHFMRACVQLMKYEWDYLFKTDNSSYVNKAELIKLLEKKPRTKFYGGHPFSGGADPAIINDFMWGEGLALSRDVVADLIDMFAINPYDKLGADDTILGFKLKDRFPWDGTMFIHNYHHQPNIPKAHVYRCANEKADATKFDDDMRAMREIHKLLHHEGINTSNVV
jgi:hypothetical protein